jgi:hypothetical protein
MTIVHMQARSHFFTIFKNLALSIKVCILNAVQLIIFRQKLHAKMYVGLVSRRRQGLAKFQRDIFETRDL